MNKECVYMNLLGWKFNVLFENLKITGLYIMKKGK